MREIETTIDSRELSEWMAYDRIDPIGPDRFDALAATVAYAAAQPHSRQRLDPRQFIPKWEPPPPQSSSQIMSIFKQAKKAFDSAANRKAK